MRNVIHTQRARGNRRVPTPKWLVVARNEYRIRTSRIRKIRRYFPILVVAFLTVYVVFIAPAFVGLFVDDFLALMVTQAAVAMVQIILFMMFVWFMIIPITDTLREEQTGQLEIFLAAPLKPSDVLLGEFLGRMPFHAIFITVITGGFTALLQPLGFDPVQTAITVMVFVVTFLLATWIGTVIAAVLRTRLGKTARGRDIGRALAMIIALPLVALVYAIQFGGLLEVLADPGTSGAIRVILNVLPSSWGAEIIVGFTSSPGNVLAVGFQTILYFGGLIAFLAATLWVGTRVANRAYSLEPTTFIAAKAKPNGVFYRTVKRLGGGASFGTLLVSVFKDYGRRLENLSSVVYIMGLLFLMLIFIVPNVSAESGGPPVALIIAQFLFPLLVVMVTGETTVRGKDNLFIYRKAPAGEDRFVKAMLMKSWLIAVPIAGFMTVFASILGSQTDTISLLITTGLMMLIVAANVVFVLGLFLLNPAFSLKSVRLGLNVFITILVSVVIFAVSMFILMAGHLDPFDGILYVQILQVVLSWCLGGVFLYIGKRKLNRME